MTRKDASPASGQRKRKGRVWIRWCVANANGIALAHGNEGALAIFDDEDDAKCNCFRGDRVCRVEIREIRSKP
jgi:hypothetical protein